MGLAGAGEEEREGEGRGLKRGLDGRRCESVHIMYAYLNAYVREAYGGEGRDQARGVRVLPLRGGFVVGGKHSRTCGSLYVRP